MLESTIKLFEFVVLETIYLFRIEFIANEIKLENLDIIPFNISRQIRPNLSIFGWYNFVMNLTL
jgi:hypothetical protein